MMVAIVLALLTAPTITDVPRSFESCAAAVAYATQAAEVGLLSYELTYAYSRAPQFSRNGKVLFHMRVAIANPTITLPLWVWPGETPGQAAEFERFRANILLHERGHWAVAARYISKYDTTEWLPDSMTRTEAAAHFKTAFDTIAEGLKDAQNFYDSVTDHGREQHRAGEFGIAAGDDTVLTCDGA